MTEQQKQVRVIRDTRDARYDYFIPAKRAAELYQEGKLGWDVTNRAYCTDSHVKVV